ncbi:glycerol-3-phosphate dehydrogenase [Exilibacterium tricleocarpae]|uniref:Glycerol-3-phosphate dehydrogenase n=1 Tax=Exilibacterium tricleocarpae TaxID=2591008 RepID=A0A545SS33_9GAMM|nr:glycerol-3-phosphate dehydrogenase [Exilibacterium tricleocarpae]TQV67726.1 glycerol-3-phosphate dehydrogenase [Exilibacterium tricleocarpae]
MAETLDILVIGGGINGTGIARDAAGRGLKVLLCEKADLAAATSSASSKLIHGGLRYLEYYEFGLVRKALIERETLLAAAPHIIKPMRFVLPHHRGLRPALLLRLGLFLYDHLGGRKVLPASKGLNLNRHPAGTPLKDEFTRGFEYSDCWVDDARLVVLNALDARERGAEILTRTTCAGARRNGGIWDVELQQADGSRKTYKTRALVNAAGPWVADVLNQVSPHSAKNKRMRLIKGSHIIVDKLFDGDHAYIFQNADGRIIFAIPYQDHFTLIGTTDVAYQGDLDTVSASDEETRYICAAASDYFKRAVVPADVRGTYSGVRPLYDDGSEDAASVTRDYVLNLDTADGAAPLLSVFGGKITTYRKLAEHVMSELQPLLGFSLKPWTARMALPGGDIPNADFDGFCGEMSTRYAWLPQPLLMRLLQAYGTRVDRLLGKAADTADLGEDFGGGLYEAELTYLKDTEWATCAEDVLWRRSKLGLHLPAAAHKKVADWFAKATEIAA